MDTSRAHLPYILACRESLTRCLQGILTATALAQELHILATARALLGLPQVVSSQTASWRWLYWCFPSPPLVIALFLLHLSGASLFSSNHGFLTELACLFSRILLDPIPTKAILVLLPSKWSSTFFAAATPIWTMLWSRILQSSWHFSNYSLKFFNTNFKKNPQQVSFYTAWHHFLASFFAPTGPA